MKVGKDLYNSVRKRVFGLTESAHDTLTSSGVRFHLSILIPNWTVMHRLRYIVSQVLQ